MNNLPEKEYGGRHIYHYNSGQGIAQQTILVNRDEGIYIFGDISPFIARDLIDAARVNTEQRGRIVIEQSGRNWKVYVVNVDGTVKNGGKVTITSEDIKKHHETLNQNRGNQANALRGQTVANVNGLATFDDGNDGERF